MSTPSKVAKRFAEAHWRAALPRVLQLLGDPEEVEELVPGCELAEVAGGAAVKAG